MLRNTIVAIALSGAAAHGAVMVQPVSVASTTPLFNSSYQLTNMINQDGLSTQYISGVTDYATYMAAVPRQESNPLTRYAVQSEATSVIYDLDLGDIYTVTNFLLWNGPTTAQSRVSTFSLIISSSPTFATFANLGTYSSSPSSAHPVAAEGFNLTQGTGRYVRLSVNNSGAVRTLIGEVAFAVVPEPSTALLSAFGTLALMRRSRRK